MYELNRNPYSANTSVMNVSSPHKKNTSYWSECLISNISFKMATKTSVSSDSLSDIDLHISLEFLSFEEDNDEHLQDKALIDLGLKRRILSNQMG